MVLAAFNVSLFLLGVLGSLWTTLSALMEYCFDRIEELDRRIPEVIFKEILPSYAKPIVHQNLRTCSFPEAGTPLEPGCVLEGKKHALWQSPPGVAMLFYILGRRTGGIAAPVRVNFSGPTFLVLAEVSLDRGVPPPLKIYPGASVPLLWNRIVHGGCHKNTCIAPSMTLSINTFGTTVTLHWKISHRNKKRAATPEDGIHR